MQANGDGYSLDFCECFLLFLLIAFVAVCARRQLLPEVLGPSCSPCMSCDSASVCVSLCDLVRNVSYLIISGKSQTCFWNWTWKVTFSIFTCSLWAKNQGIIVFFCPKLCFKSAEGTWLRWRKKKETNIVLRYTQRKTWAERSEKKEG